METDSVVETVCPECENEILASRTGLGGVGYCHNCDTEIEWEAR